MNWYDGLVITMAVGGLWVVFFLCKAMLDSREKRKTKPGPDGIESQQGDAKR